MSTKSDVFGLRFRPQEQTRFRVLRFIPREISGLFFVAINVAVVGSRDYSFYHGGDGDGSNIVVSYYR